jgi:hypothetical protein
MGMIIKADYFMLDQDGILRPIIYVHSGKELENNAISINAPLAKALQPVSPKFRAIRLQSILQKIVQELPTDSTICEFDAVFNPQYKIDVLTMLISACKANSFSVLWPGTYEDGRLIYAVEGRPDYKIYDINNYDVTVII